MASDTYKTLIGFPGIQQVLDCSFTLSQGITPSVASLTIAPQLDGIPEIGTLSITFGVNGEVSQTFPQMQVDQASFVRNDQGLIVRLSLFDRRWRWAFGEINGAYNITQANGEIDKLQLRTPQQLATMCLLVMGEVDFDVSQLPNDTNPETLWEAQNPAQALDNLVNPLACRVCLNIDNRVYIVQAGKGKTLPGDLILEASETLKNTKRPDSLRVVCGKTRYQPDFVLEAVGKDLDGTVKPIDKLSYKPKAGWGGEAVEGPLPFPNVDNLITPAKVGPAGDARTLARQTVWRWFRITNKGRDGKKLVLPGYGPIKWGQQIVPIESVLCLTIGQQNPAGDPNLEPLRQVPFNANLFGTFVDYEKNAFKNSRTLTEWRFGFSILSDPEGIVQVDRPAYQYDPKKLALTPLQAVKIAPTLYLRTACSVRDPITWAWERYRRALTYPDPRGTDAKILRHEEIQLNFIPTYNDAGDVVKVESNLTLVNQQCDYYIAAEDLRYKAEKAQEATYMGILRIPLDGAIVQVGWKASNESPSTTHASRNMEGSASVEPYERRRLVERVRLSTFIDLQAELKKLKKGGVGKLPK